MIEPSSPFFEAYHGLHKAWNPRITAGPQTIKPVSIDGVKVPIRTTVHPEEDKWFKQNPNVAGYAVMAGHGLEQHPKGTQPHVVFNPHSPGVADKTQRKGLAKLEMLRIAMGKLDPGTKLTGAQRTKLKGMNYPRDPNTDRAWRQTVISRAGGGDNSMAPYTPSQRATAARVWDSLKDKPPVR